MSFPRVFWPLKSGATARSLPLFCAFPAAADVLSTTGGDPKAPRAVDAARGAGQAVGAGGPELAHGLTEVLSRACCPPHPQGHHLAPRGGPEPNHKSPKNNHYFYIFYQKTKTLGCWKILVGGVWCRFLLAFSKQVSELTLFRQQLAFGFVLCLRVHGELSFLQEKNTIKLELEGSKRGSCL